MKLLRTLAAALLVLPAAALPARADSLGIRPLGGDYESGRTVGPGHWAIDGGLWVPSFTTPDNLKAVDQKILDNWRLVPAWPQVRVLYGLPDGNEIEGMAGPILGGGYRKLFLRSEAPWPGEYLQLLVQLGAGLQLSNYKQYGLTVPAPMGYIRFPAIFEDGPVTVHVAGGGYYLFNNQPIAEVDMGIEYEVFEHFRVGGLTKLRMDSTKLTPTEGSWTFGGGVRYQLGDRLLVQVDLNQDASPPIPTSVVPFPRVEFPFRSITATTGYYF